MRTPADTQVAGAVTANAVASSWASSRDLLIRGDRRVWDHDGCRPALADWVGPTRAAGDWQVLPIS